MDRAKTQRRNERCLADGVLVPIGWLEADTAPMYVLDAGTVEGIVDWTTGDRLDEAGTFAGVRRRPPRR